MKNITIIAIAIFCNILAHAQDFEPVQQKFYTFTDTTYTTIDSIYIDGNGNDRFIVTSYIMSKLPKGIVLWQKN